MPNHARQLRIAALTVLGSAAMFAPAKATAQLGRLKKAAADAAKDAAGVKTDAPAQAAGNANYVITADRLAAVMAVMDAGMDRAAKEAAARAVSADYNTKKKAYETCAETQLKAMNGRPPSMEAMQKVAGEAQRTTDISQRMMAAQQANRNREYAALVDTLGVASVRSTLVMYGMESKCGAPVYMPAALLDEAAAKMSRASSGQSESGSGSVTVAPAQRAGMTTQQFGMVRERAALWALQQTNNAPADNNKYGIFTPEEHAVLSAQGAKLKKWAPIFKESPATWAGWGDIKSW